MSIFLSNLRLPVRELQFIISVTGYPVLRRMRINKITVLLITGCGASNSIEDSAGADSQIAENAGQTGTEEKAAFENIDEEDFEDETVKELTRGMLFSNYFHLLNNTHYP